MFDLEQYHQEKKLNQNLSKIIGCDEVGRGPLAGPVISCSVLVHEDGLEEILNELSQFNITDSKKLTSLKRQKILDELGIEIAKLSSSKVYSLELKNCKLKYSLAEISNTSIDEENIFQASLRSMGETLKSHRCGNALALIDGKFVPKLSGKLVLKPVIKGDSKSLLIGLASIIAKEYRDYLMKEYSIIYPGYGFEKHAGYPTKRHKEAIERLGVSKIHRKSFKGVREFV